MGGGERLTGGGVAHWAAVWSTRITPVPLLTGVRHHPPGRTDQNLPMLRCPGSPGFP